MKVKTFAMAAAIAAALAIGALPAAAAPNDGQLGGPPDPSGVPDDTICAGGAAVTGVTGFTRLIGVTIPIVAVATVQCAGGGPASTMGSMTGMAGELPGGTFCGPGQVAVGITGREGDFIDNLFLRCALPDGSGPITQSVPSFGGPGLGGQPDGPYDCPAGQVLTGLTGQSVFTGTTIRYVEIVCVPAPPACPPNDDDDDDNDGLTNNNESLFGNLLNNADSDDDGIRDGNDDGDDDGEDDEDEDDDQSCPDEDDDGDGEDDEDEDDEEGDD
jgi:hypothetical protein